MLDKTLKTLSLVLLLALAVSCATPGAKFLDEFVDTQKTKISEKSAYIQADFDFYAAAMEPRQEDLARLKSAWQEHGQAFPDSEAIRRIERSLSEAESRSVLVSLFMSNYDNADLKNKSLGWSVSPAPNSIEELSETDVVLRTLMPVQNSWARYFLLRYRPGTEDDISRLIISDRTSRVDLPLKD